MSETTDLYALAAPGRDAALREINGIEISAEDRAPEALQAHLTAVIFVYLGARLGRCGEIAMSDEAFARLDGDVAWAVAGLIDNYACSLRTEGVAGKDNARRFMAVLIDALARRLAQAEDGAVALDVAADGRLAERAFDFRDHLRSAP